MTALRADPGTAILSPGDLWGTTAEDFASDDGDRDNFFWQGVEWSAGRLPRFITCSAAPSRPEVTVDWNLNRTLI
jgi:hypothetical protein